ncbi:MAG: hypothetical protein P4L55_07215 [Syntrophobacteraceae bacterium]|nr:hypothetical protein [Syntrophobacteraceae bacterium]
MKLLAGRRAGALSGAVLLCLFLSFGPARGAETLGKTGEDITGEALLPDNSKAGRPLPLAASWNAGQKPGGFSPDYQMARIGRGSHLLPWFYLPPPGWAFQDEYYESAIKKAAKLHLPLSFLSTQWESLLGYLPQYRHLPSEINPNVRATIARDIPELSPFGPVELWRRVGSRWTATPLLKKLQQWYPDPPLVLFISNNEQPRLGWWEAEQSNRFLARYGHGKSDAFKRKVIGDAWIDRYRALQGGMREELVTPVWKKNARFIGFNAFGSPNFGRTGDWMRDSLYIPNRFEPWPLAWDGASAPSGVDGAPVSNSDYTVFSPQVFEMNYVFMSKEALRLNPCFWLELSVWDGHESDPSKDKRSVYASLGQVYSPGRYAGMVRFCMWLVRPRLVRDFRFWDDTVSNSGAYFMAVADSVDMIYRNPTLRRFWRFARLVENPGRQNPYQADIPEEYRNTGRWFLLDTSLDPPGPWTMTTTPPVFALALVLGEQPHREWLVYAHSPLGQRDNVGINIPEYGSITVTVGPSGNFYRVTEKNGEARPLS